MSDHNDYLPHTDPAEITRRKHVQAVFMQACQGDNGIEFLVELGDILHFFSPAFTPEDMALQNAFKTVLHHLGSWGDDAQGRLAVIRKLRV